MKVTLLNKFVTKKEWVEALRSKKHLQNRGSYISLIRRHTDKAGLIVNDDTPLETIKSDLKQSLIESQTGQHIPLNQMIEEVSKDLIQQPYYTFERYYCVTGLLGHLIGVPDIIMRSDEVSTSILELLYDLHPNRESLEQLEFISTNNYTILNDSEEYSFDQFADMIESDPSINFSIQCIEVDLTCN